MKPEIVGLVKLAFRVELPVNMVCGTWLPGYYHGNDKVKHTYKEDHYFKEYLDKVHGVLSRPDVYMNAALLAEDNDCILSYAVLESFGNDGNLLHWVYTKPAWRKMGLAKELIPSDVFGVTHTTSLGEKLKPAHWRIEPLA